MKIFICVRKISFKDFDTFMQRIAANDKLDILKTSSKLPFGNSMNMLTESSEYLQKLSL